MVLVDTSIWIRFLQGREPVASELDRLLSVEEVLGHEFVYGELLLGNLGPRDALLAAYATMDQAETATHGEVAALVKARKLAGCGIGWVDAHLLASTLLEGAMLWTEDTALRAVVGELGALHRALPA